MKIYTDEFERITALLTGEPVFAYESQQMFNIAVDNIIKPVVFAPALGAGTYTKQGGGMGVTLRVVVQFLQQTQFENDLLLNQSIITDMEELALEFMQHMNTSAVLQHPESYETQYYYETFDANFAGIGLTFDCKLLTPLKLC